MVINASGFLFINLSIALLFQRSFVRTILVDSINAYSSSPICCKSTKTTRPLARMRGDSPLLFLNRYEAFLQNEIIGSSVSAVHKSNPCADKKRLTHHINYLAHLTIHQWLNVTQFNLCFLPIPPLSTKFVQIERKLCKGSRRVIQ
jgi:hypothetical protein